VDKDQPVTNVQTMEELLESGSSRTRFTMFLLAIFSATALILAIVGTYGVFAYSVAQRTQELGIRMGAGSGQGRHSEAGIRPWPDAGGNCDQRGGGRRGLIPRKRCVGSSGRMEA